jgi:hypothetical protein
MESIREWPKYKTLEINQYDKPKKLLKTNGSEFYRCQTPVSNLTPGIHTSLTPVLTRQNSTRVTWTASAPIVHWLAINFCS